MKKRLMEVGAIQTILERVLCEGCGKTAYILTQSDNMDNIEYSMGLMGTLKADIMCSCGTLRHSETMFGGLN